LDREADLHFFAAVEVASDVSAHRGVVEQHVGDETLGSIGGFVDEALELRRSGGDDAVHDDSIGGSATQVAIE
jgi:hypothetical protein